MQGPCHTSAAVSERLMNKQCDCAARLDDATGEDADAAGAVAASSTTGCRRLISSISAASAVAHAASTRAAP